MVIRWLFIPLFFISCATKKTGIAFGGGGALAAEGQKPTESIINKALLGENTVLHSAADSSGRKAKRELKKKYFRDHIGFAVDTVPPTAERNKADQKLLKADNAIRRYAEIRTNMKTVMAVFIPVSASLFLPVLVQLTLNFSSTNLLTVFLSLVLVGFLISVWSLMFIYFLFRPELKAKRACRLIRRAPLHAPKNRFIEYEVRSLLMLNNYMSRRMQIKHIRKLREISQTDLYNPWLNKIKSLRYYEESQFTESHGSKGISNNLLLLIPLLGPLLLLLISLVNN